MSVRLRLCAFLVASTLPALPAVPAAAGTGGETEAAADGIVALQAEVMLLVALEGFAEPVPARLKEVHDEWAHTWKASIGPV